MSLRFNTLFQDITSKTSNIFTRHKEPEENGFQDLLSNLNKQPQAPSGSLSNLGSGAKPSVPSNNPPISDRLKVEDENILDEADAGWGINDDDLIIDNIEPNIDEKKEPEIEKVEKIEKKKFEEEKKPADALGRLTGSITKLDENEETRGFSTGSRRKLSTQLHVSDYLYREAY